MTNDRVFYGTCDDASFVYFNAHGVPWCGNPETVLVERFGFTLALGPHTRTVTLDGITGRVTVQ